MAQGRSGREKAKGVVKPFDATTKALVEAHPEDWVRWLGLPGGVVRVVDADLATVTTEADRVLRVEESAGPYLVHIEFQSAHELNMVGRLLRYNVLLRTEFGLPALSVLLLLRREANVPGATGVLRQDGPTADSHIEFGYRVVRLWEADAAGLLTGGLGVLPLAPLAAVSEDALPGVVRALTARIEREAGPTEAKDLLASASILMGLKYSAAFIQELMKGVRRMKESTVYQEIFAEGEARGQAEGEVRGKRETIRRLGTKRFGKPDAATAAALEAIGSSAKLDALAERLLEVESWMELLAPGR